MRLVSLLVVLAACGNVASKGKDAGHDGPGGTGDGPGASDAPRDAAAQPLTAIGASNITQFTAAGGGAPTKIPYVTDYDDLSEWDATMSTFTPTWPGDYLLCGSVFMGATNLSVPVELVLFRNGIKDRIVAGGNGIASGCRAVRLMSGDRITFQVTLTQTAGVTVAPDPTWNWMSIHRTTVLTDGSTSSSFSSPAGSFVLVPYDVAVVNDNSAFDLTAHHLKALAAGDYEFCASMRLGPEGIEGELDLYLNGLRERALSEGVTSTSGCRSVRLAANDTVEVQMFQNFQNETVSSDLAGHDWISIMKQPIQLSVTGIAAFDTVSRNSTLVPYTTVLFDDASQFNTNTHTFTAASAGDYEVCASLLVPSSTVDGDEIDIYKGTTRVAGLSYGHTAVSGCHVMRLAVGDKIHIETYTVGGKSFTNDANWDWFEVSKVH